MSKKPHKWRDVAWKTALADGAQGAIEYFMPDLAKDMDTSKKISAISGVELPVIGSDTDKGMRVSDMFFNVPMLDGDERNVALLLEQQGSPDENFALKMLELYVRLREKTQQQTTALAIFTGDAKVVDRFVDTCYGVELSFKYNTFYLPDKNIEKLREDKRPFARVVLAGRLELDAGDDLARREKYAWEILETTREREYDRGNRRLILDFSKRIFRLRDPAVNDKLKEAYQMKLIPLDEYVQKIIIDDAVEEAVEEAIDKNTLEVALKIARKMLIRKMPINEIVDLTGLAEEDILELA